jgi:hypothetical protein
MKIGELVYCSRVVRVSGAMPPSNENLKAFQVLTLLKK